MCLGVILLGSLVLGVLCASMVRATISSPSLGKFTEIIYSNTLSIPFSLSSSSGTPIMGILFRLDWSHIYLNILSFLEIFLSLSTSASLHYSSWFSISLPASCNSSILLLSPSRDCFISVISLHTLSISSCIFLCISFSMVITFILNSFSGILVKSISPFYLSGDVWVILVCIKLFCIFMVVEVVVGSCRMCQLAEQNPFLFACRLPFL